MAKRKRPVLTDQEVLYLLDRGIYRVDLETGEIFNGSGSPLEGTLRLWKDPAYRIVNLCHENKLKRILAHRLVWMAGTGSIIPVGFEVHHDDGDHLNNSFENLFCLHAKDHSKIHRVWQTYGAERIAPEDPTNDVPF